MNARSTRQQLAEELQIPLDQIDRVTDAVRQQSDRPLSATALLNAVRNHPEKREDLQHIYQQFYTAEVRAIAAALDITYPEAEQLCHSLGQQLPFPVTEQTVWQAIQEEETAVWTEAQLSERLKSGWIATQLGASLQETRQLPALIQERTQQAVTYDDLLKYLDIPNQPHTLHGVVAYFDKEWAAVQEIARLLDIPAAEAWQFIGTTRETVSQPVPRDDTLHIVRQLSERHRRLDILEEVVDYQYIARELRLSPLKKVQQLVNSLQEEYNLSRLETRQQIIAAIPYLPENTAEPVETRLNTLFLIATTRQMSLEEANRYIATVQARAGRPVLYSAIAEVFNELSIHANMASDVVKKLNEREAARQLGATLTTLHNFLDIVSAEVDAVITPERVLKALAEGIDKKQLHSYFRRQYYPIPHIARLMNIPSHTVRAVIKDIHSQFSEPVPDKEIVDALRALPPEQRELSYLIQQLKARWVAAALGIDKSEATHLITQIQAETGRAELAPAHIAAALLLLPPEDHTLPDLKGLLQTSQQWHKSEEKTFEIIQAALKKCIRAVALQALWPVAQQLIPTHQNEEGLINSLNVRYWLKPDETTPENINQLATAVNLKSHSVMLWEFLARNFTPKQLAVADFNHGLWLAEKVAGYRPLWPDKQKGQQWLSYQQLQAILRDDGLPAAHRRPAQIHQLMTYRQSCWQEVCSERREYQVPSAGRAEIYVPPLITDLIHLTSVRFFQEQVKAPGVFIQFRFEELRAVGIVKIYPGGQIEGFHQLAGDEWFQVIIEAVALSHYRDLVVPTYPDTAPVHQNKRKGTHTESSWGKRPSSAKSFPGQRSRQKVYSLKEWYGAQEIARHNVRGHTRWIGAHFEADALKQRQALQAGVRLLPGFTWVIEHERGTPQVTEIPLAGEDLTAHTLFLAPPKASSELTDILS